MSRRARGSECVLQRESENLLELYEIHDVLGKGQFGVTYRCTERSTGNEYACKSIAKWKLKTTEDVKDVRREVAIMHLLVGDPNIVELKGAYEDKSHVHLVMELCRGGELFDRIVSRHHYSERAAAAIFRTIITAVHTCHFHGVMHRDLKPENFLFVDTSEESLLKVTDFGLSVFFEPDQIFKDSVGSPYYVAPEVLRRNYGPQCDVWSAGIILYILLSGRPPFRSNVPSQMNHDIKHAKLDLTSTAWLMISKDAKELVAKMLTRDPQKRLTPQQVLEHPWIAQDGVASPQPLDSTVLRRLQSFAALNKFKKVAFNFIASTLSNEEIVGLKKVFKSMDRDNNGTISLAELQDYLSRKGCHLSEEEVNQLLMSADLDQDGVVNYNEFVAATLHVSKLQRQDQIYAAFQHFDADGSGFITADEIARALSEHSININRATLFSIIAEADKDHDGRINYDEFTAMIMRSSDEAFASIQALSALPSGRVPNPHLPIASPMDN